MATELVKMDKAQLNVEIQYTADIIRMIYDLLYSITGNYDYRAPSLAQYTWDASNGFYSPLYTAIGILVNTLSGGGGTPTLDGRTVGMGAFTVTSQATSYTVNHGMGAAPEYILVVKAGEEDVSNHITGMVVNPYGALALRRGSTGWVGGAITPQVDSTSFVLQSSTSAHVISANSTFYWFALGAKPQQ